VQSYNFWSLAPSWWKLDKCPLLLFSGRYFACRMCHVYFIMVTPPFQLVESWGNLSDSFPWGPGVVGKTLEGGPPHSLCTHTHTHTHTRLQPPGVSYSKTSLYSASSNLKKWLLTCSYQFMVLMFVVQRGSNQLWVLYLPVSPDFRVAVCPENSVLPWIL